MDFTANYFDPKPLPSGDGFAAAPQYHQHDNLLDQTQYMHDFGQIFDYETTGLINNEDWFQSMPEITPLFEPNRPVEVDPCQITAPTYTTLSNSSNNMNFPIIPETFPYFDQTNVTFNLDTGHVIANSSNYVAPQTNQSQQQQQQMELISNSFEFLNPTIAPTDATAASKTSMKNTFKSNKSIASQTFVCPECNQPFQSKRSLSNHKRSHLIRTTFTCVLCEKEFSVRRQLQIHLRVHKNSGFNNKKEYHQQQEQQPEVVRKCFSCSICYKVFEHRHLLDHHRSSSHADNNDSTRIPVSPTNTTDQTHSIHMTNKSKFINRTTPILVSFKPNPDTKRVRCTHADCTEDFETVQQLRRHQTIHRLKRFKCSRCHREYHSKPVYQSHVRLCQPETDDCVLLADDDIDSGLMECRICGQLFENRRVLKFHRQFCTDDKAVEEEKHRAKELREQLGLGEIVIKQEIEDGDI